MRTGQPVAELFQTEVGQVVERLTAQDRGALWIYGEMVDVLAEERNFAAARYLEELWNELGLRQSFTLLCGYSSAHFADASMAHMLAEICNRHTHIHSGDEDVMGNWVLKRRSTDRVDIQRPRRLQPRSAPTRKEMRPEGVEPPAYRFEACRSIQLSYGRVSISLSHFRAT